MGEVFRARDTRLNRDVAIKVLPAAFADDPERLARFTREAQTLASLNHPNIATIYGIEGIASAASSADRLAMTEGGGEGAGAGATKGARSAGATIALVMELVEGEDLSAHVARGPIPIAEALPIARQIAEALEAAHEHGIVHRDLKPANIKVRSDGTVKVLDFGLAKAMDPAGASSSNPNVSHSPTLTHQGTSAGMIIGTAAYMSPEQAKGKAVDKRADIWAFGVVLYEMMSGQRLFKGEDVSDTLAAVLRQDVDFSALPKDAPSPVRRLVARCLDRDLKRRLRDIGEARVLLENPASPLVSDSPPVAAAPAPRAPGWRRALPWAAAVVFGAALATIPLLWTRSRVKPAYDQPIRLSIQTPDTLGNLPALSAAPVISPDGRFVVFPSPLALGKPPVLWLRPMGALEAQPLPGTEGADWPFWSPDSRHVGFAASGKLKKIDISGGPPQNLCDVVGFTGGTWNREGVLVFSEGGRLFLVSEAGGPRSDLGSSEQTGSAYLPAFLPDGRHFIYSTAPQGLRVASLDGGPSIQVLDVRSMAAYASPGFLLYHREGALFAHAFDAKRLQLAGEPVRVADGVAFSEIGRAAFSVSDTGVLVFRTGRASDSVVELAWMSRTGKAMGTVGEPANYRQIRLSPDEKRVALAGAGAGSRIFTLDLGSRVTSVSPTTTTVFRARMTPCGGRMDERLRSTCGGVARSGSISRSSARATPPCCLSRLTSGGPFPTGHPTAGSSSSKRSRPPNCTRRPSPATPNRSCSRDRRRPSTRRTSPRTANGSPTTPTNQAPGRPGSPRFQHSTTGSRCLRAGAARRAGARTGRNSSTSRSTGR